MNQVTTERLRSLVERLLELQPAVKRYEEVENLLAGLMLCADVGEIELPDRGRVKLASSPSKIGLGLVVEPEETPMGAIIRIRPFKGLPGQH